MARLFVSQQQMDRWTTEGKVKLDDDIMSVPAMNRSFRISGAVYFTQLIDGSDDKQLIGRVKSVEQLGEMSAEHYGASVILGETGYECVEGFVGVPVEGAPVAGSGLMKL
jgi:hypothetical protein